MKSNNSLSEIFRKPFSELKRRKQLKVWGTIVTYVVRQHLVTTLAVRRELITNREYYLKSFVSGLKTLGAMLAFR